MIRKIKISLFFVSYFLLINLLMITRSEAVLDMSRFTIENGAIDDALQKQFVNVEDAIEWKWEKFAQKFYIDRHRKYNTPEKLELKVYEIDLCETIELCHNIWKGSVTMDIASAEIGETLASIADNFTLPKVGTTISTARMLINRNISIKGVVGVKHEVLDEDGNSTGVFDPYDCYTSSGGGAPFYLPGKTSGPAEDASIFVPEFLMFPSMPNVFTGGYSVIVSLEGARSYEHSADKYYIEVSIDEEGSTSNVISSSGQPTYTIKSSDANTLALKVTLNLENTLTAADSKETGYIKGDPYKCRITAQAPGRKVAFIQNSL